MASYVSSVISRNLNINFAPAGTEDPPAMQLPVTPPGGPQPATPVSILATHRGIHLWTVQLMALRYTKSFFAQSVAKVIVFFTMSENTS